MPSTNSTLLWVVLALTAASIEPILIKMGYRAQADPLQLLALKNIVAALIMFLLSQKQLLEVPRLLAVFRSTSGSESQASQATVLARSKASSVLIGLLTISLLLCATNLFMLFSLQRIAAVEFITVTTTTPLAVALVNMYLGNDTRGKLFWLGLVCAIAGVILSVGPGGFSIDIAGLLMALGAVVSSTIYRLRAEKVLKTLDSRLVSLCIFAVNGALAVLILPLIGAINMTMLGYCVWMGAAAALANLAFIASIKALGATRMSVINLVQRPLVVAGAAIALNEICTVWQWIGIAMVVGGVQLAQVRPVRTDVLASSSMTHPIVVATTPIK